MNVLDFKKDVGLWHGILTVSVTHTPPPCAAHTECARCHTGIRVCTHSRSLESPPALGRKAVTARSFKLSTNATSQAQEASHGSGES